MGPWRQDRLVALCGGAALLSLAVHGLGASLTWEAPVDCPGQDDAERALIEALGAPLADTPPAEITVQLASDPDASRFLAVLRMRPTPEASWVERTLEAETCSAAHDAAVLAISLALAPPQSAEPRPAEPQSAEPRATEPSTEEPRDAQPPAVEHAPGDPRSELNEPPATSTEKDHTAEGPSPQEDGKDEPSDDPPLRWAVEASLIGDHGSLPGLAPGVELGATFGSSAHALRLTGLAFPERSTVLDASSGGTFALFAASLAGCAARTTRHLHLAACAGAELGRMQGRGTGISAPTEGSAFWLAPRVDVAASTLSDFRPFLRAGAVLPLVRPTFALDGRPVHQADALAFRLAVGVEVVLE